MAGSVPKAAFLRQSYLGNAGHSVIYPLLPDHEMVLGREADCQIVLDPSIYSGVSRYHAKIVPLGAELGWQLCDLNSTNGTYLNGRRLQGCQLLQEGDQIALGRRGPQFTVEFQVPTRSSTLPIATNPYSIQAGSKTPSAHRSAQEGVTLSQLFPIMSTGRDLAHKAYLLPGIVTVTFVVMMFVAVGNPLLFNSLVAVYIAAGAYYFIYQLCGKHKPWWLLLGAALMTALLLLSPVLDGFVMVFQAWMPGQLPRPSTPIHLLMLLVQMFWGVGMMEELLKALPVLLLYGLGTQLRSPLREQIGIWEPLDGILLGTASAVGFTLVETLGQYVPDVIQAFHVQAGHEIGQLSGLQLLIARILGSIAGHLAYSGYLGYFIGLSVLKPTRRWQILGIGYITAAALHTLWNISGMVNLVALAVVGSVSYAFLTAAILKARALSPTRANNFATRFSK